MKPFWRLFELAIVLLGSMLTGFLIGGLQDYVSLGFDGYGFGRNEFKLAIDDGGTIGVLFALPTGLLAYYIVLGKHVTPKQTAVIVLGSLVAGLGLATVLSWISSAFTPIATIGLAFGVREYRLSKLQTLT